MPALADIQVSTTCSGVRANLCSRNLVRARIYVKQAPCSAKPLPRACRFKSRGPQVAPLALWHGLDGPCAGDALG
eukprot:8511049-Alexandrium_andersonii.AAC.1